MSNKDFNKLNTLDRKLRMHFQAGEDTPNIRVTIELINGFELFNTRPYHNYESWSDGYRIKDTETGVIYESEDLDDAIYGFIDKVNKVRKEKGLRVTEDFKVKVVEDVKL